MTTSPHTTLAALDFETVTCTCPEHPCTAAAQFVVEAHAIGHCEDEGLTVDGNHVQLLCEDCFTRLVAYVADGIARLRKITARPYCDECQAPIAEIADVVRKVGVL